MKIDSNALRGPSNAGMRKRRRMCFEQTLPEDRNDSFRKGGHFRCKSVVGDRFCAMHQ
jgi:hypothetical protein